jgi:hypothetical protein
LLKEFVVFKFKSKASADIMMFNAQGQVLVGVWGKSGDVAGILQPSEMANAIAALNAYADRYSDGVNGASQANVDTGHSPVQGDEDGLDEQVSVSWAQRFTPVISMLNASVAEQVVVTWTVS